MTDKDTTPEVVDAEEKQVDKALAALKKGQFTPAGKAISGRDKIYQRGDAIAADDLPGGKETLDKLVKAKVIIKV